MARWHSDPNLKGRFHPEFPDDLEVLVHDGGPRLTSCRPELMWVRVSDIREGNYTGILLNQPHQLNTVSQDSEILFVARERVRYPFRVTERYLAERGQWTIHPCQQCGMPELFDAPSDLIAKVFPNLPAGTILDTFTSICPLCGGVQVVEAKDAADNQARQNARNWWQIWK